MGSSLPVILARQGAFRPADAVRSLHQRRTDTKGALLTCQLPSDRRGDERGCDGSPLIISGRRETCPLPDDVARRIIKRAMPAAAQDRTALHISASIDRKLRLDRSFLAVCLGARRIVVRAENRPNVPSRGRRHSGLLHERRSVFGRLHRWRARIRNPILLCGPNRDRRDERHEEVRRKTPPGLNGRAGVELLLLAAVHHGWGCRNARA